MGMMLLGETHWALILYLCQYRAHAIFKSVIFGLSELMDMCKRQSAVGLLEFSGYTSLPTGTLWCHYNEVRALKNPYKRHPIARLVRRGMGCLSWIDPLVDIPSHSVIIYLIEIDIPCFLEEKMNWWIDEILGWLKIQWCFLPVCFIV